MRGLDLERILLGEVAHGGDVGVPEERVVVEVHLGVERDDVAGLGDHQRVDLGQRRVGLDVGLRQRLEQRGRLARGLPFEPETVDHRAGLERQQAEVRIESPGAGSPAGSRAATSSMSMPPAADAITIGFACWRSSVIAA